MTAKNSGAKNPLEEKRVAVLGYGSQGRAQALNLRDSGITPLIGLPKGSKSRGAAKKAGFDIVSPERAIDRGDIIAILIPDHKHKEFFDSLDMNILRGKALIFAHGLSVAFQLVVPPSYCDIIMVAPHGPGVLLRERYLSGATFTAFVGIKQDYSGEAGRIAKSYAGAIGCPPGNLFESTFETEAVGDIFGEQAVLCGGLIGLLESGFETLVRKGHSRESAYLECVHQLDLIIDLVKLRGPAGMFERISKTAAFGSLRAKDRLFDSGFSRKLDKLYEEIKSGRFAGSLIEEDKRGLAGFESMISKSRKSPLQKTHDKLSGRLSDRPPSRKDQSR